MLSAVRFATSIAIKGQQVLHIKAMNQRQMQMRSNDTLDFNKHIILYTQKILHHNTFAYIWLILMVHVFEYTIYAWVLESYGILSVLRRCSAWRELKGEVIIRSPLADWLQNTASSTKRKKTAATTTTTTTTTTTSVFPTVDG